MRTWGLAGVAALGVALGASVAEAQPPRGKATTTVEQPGWWSGLFVSKPKEEAKKPAPPPVTEMSQEARAAELARLEKAYLRRLAVCDRLRDVAREKGDDVLDKEAQQLNEAAWKLYLEKANKVLGVASLAMEDEGPEARPERNSPAALRSGPIPPRVRAGGSLQAEASRRSVNLREGER